MKFTFSNEVKRQVMIAQNGYCDSCEKRIHSIHHKLRNIVENRRKYPLLINSVINAVGLCDNCHAQKPHEYVITSAMAENIENFLRQLKKGE